MPNNDPPKTTPSFTVEVAGPPKPVAANNGGLQATASGGPKTVQITADGDRPSATNPSATATASGNPSATATASGNPSATFTASGNPSATAIASNDENDDDLNSVTKNKENKDNDNEEEGEIKVPEHVVKPLLKDFVDSDGSIKDAFKKMVENYFIFRENYAIIRKEWQEKLKNEDPSFFNTLRGIDPSVEAMAKKMLEHYKEKVSSKKEDQASSPSTVAPASATNAPSAANPTVTPVPSAPASNQPQVSGDPTSSSLSFTNVVKEGLSKWIAKAKERVEKKKHQI